MSSSVTPGVSRTPPSVTIPAPPRASTRAARMSPIVPAPVSPRASMTSTSPGAIDSTARFCASCEPLSDSRTSARMAT